MSVMHLLNTYKSECFALCVILNSTFSYIIHDATNFRTFSKAEAIYTVRLIVSEYHYRFYIAKNKVSSEVYSKRVFYELELNLNKYTSKNPKVTCRKEGFYVCLLENYLLIIVL